MMRLGERPGGRKLGRPSKAELLAEPLTRARDLLRVLADSRLDGAAAAHKPIEAALAACERLLRALPGVETSAGRRAFTREFYRAWSTVLEVREFLSEDSFVRVFGEIEDAVETTRRLLRRFEELGDGKGYRT